MSPKENYIFENQVMSLDEDELTPEEVVLWELHTISRIVNAPDLPDLFCYEEMPDSDSSGDEVEEHMFSEHFDENEETYTDHSDSDGDDLMTIKISLGYYLLNDEICCGNCAQQLGLISIIPYVLKNKTFFDYNLFLEFALPKCFNCLQDIEYTFLD